MTTGTAKSTKEQIQHIVDEMSLDELLNLLDYLNNQADPDTLSPEEEALVAQGEAEIDLGEYVTLDEIRGRAKNVS